MNALFRTLCILAILAFTAPSALAGPLLAAGKPSVIGRYWRDFKEYWSGAFENQGAVVLITLGAGALAMFIITRGKWKK